MTDNLTIRPSAEGAAIHDPATGDMIPAEGAVVPNNAFWQQRLIRGDVVLVVTQQPAAKPSKKES